MIAPTTKLQEAILQALEEINDALYAARQQGLIVLLPEEVDMQVSMVTDINAVSRTNTDSEADGGTTTTLREQIGADIETRNLATSENSTTVRSSSEGAEEHTTTHPSVTTSTGGGDSTTEVVINTYDA